ARERGVTVHLPVDAIVAPDMGVAEGKATDVTDIGPGEMALDIGPKTAQTYAAEIARARTLFWNGPMGVFEKKPFAAGTLAVAQAFAANREALSVVGGGDSAAAVDQMGVVDRI